MHKSKPSDGFDTKTVNESIDVMAFEIQHSIGDNAQVKMRRSRIETAIHIVLKGNPEETEKQIQKIHNSLVANNEVVLDSNPDAPQSFPEIATREETKTTAYENPFEPFSGSNS